MKKFFAFTLAEVLITLSIVGIVAALTMPTLKNNVNEKVWKTASQVFEQEIVETIKVMNIKKVLAGYNSTEDFVRALQRYLKITKVCPKDRLTECFPDTIYWGVDNVEIKTADLKSASNFGQKDWKTNLVGLQLTNGVAGIIAYNPACVQDPFNKEIGISNCISLLYDTSGNRAPNTQKKDLNSMNVLYVKDIVCGIDIKGKCFSTPINNITPIRTAECEEIKDELGIPNCTDPSRPDYWGGAVKICGGVQNMPTNQDLADLADMLFEGGTIDPYGESSNLTYVKGTGTSIGFEEMTYFVRSIWSGELADAENNKYYRFNYSAPASTAGGSPGSAYAVASNRNSNSETYSFAMCRLD